MAAAPHSAEIDWTLPPDRRFSDSLLATDPYVAIAIARDDAKHYRALYLTTVRIAHELQRATERVADQRDALRAEVRRLSDQIRRLRRPEAA